MNKQNVAVVLGGTNPHIALIENLKKRGYYTVLVDYYENPPAKQYADEHIRESTLDLGEVLEIAKGQNATLIISACIDQANATACYVAEKLGLPAPYSYETALQVTDKSVMKKMMLEGGVPTSKYITVNQVDDPSISLLSFPVVVKPGDATGSKGVRKASNPSEYVDYLTEALALSRSGEAIVEEFKTGDEFQADFFVKDGCANLIMIRKKSKLKSDDGAILQSFGSIIPAEISSELENEFRVVANRIAKTFNLKNTSLFFQAIASETNVSVVEFAARVGGGLSYRMMQEIPKFDILSATVDSYVGKDVRVECCTPSFSYATVIVYAKSGVFGMVTGQDGLLASGDIQEFFLFKSKGVFIGNDLISGNRICAVLIQAKDKGDLVKKMRNTINELEVYDIEGQPLMHKEIYEDLKV